VPHYSLLHLQDRRKADSRTSIAISLTGETPPVKPVGANPERIYVAIQYRAVASGIEFDWDEENKKHLDAHSIAPAEFEQLLNNDPVDLNSN
jgi:hypothetical protein